MINGINIGIVVVLVGIYGLLTKRNIIKMIMSLCIMNSGVILFFISIGYVFGGQAAIFEDSSSLMVDPLPQAVMLTAIVIGLGVTALALALAIKIYDEYKTLDTNKLLEK
ncbi:MAG: cation:proton antiporter subunit C [Candidatus Margulisiibacteriota bacterium]|nr:cation:proton antiporter subunit C [Candidatus Margulisiibacteriota bacterium]